MSKKSFRDRLLDILHVELIRITEHVLTDQEEEGYLIGAELVEDLADGLAFAVAAICRGHAPTIKVMLIGLEAKLAEEVASATKLLEESAAKSRRKGR